MHFDPRIVLGLPFIGCPLSYLIIDGFIIGNSTSPHLGYNALWIDAIFLAIGIFLFILVGDKNK
jgi:hypothetical protein